LGQDEVHVSASDWLGLDDRTWRPTAPSHLPPRPKPHPFKHRIRDGLISVLLLVALATIAHQCHLFGWLTAQSMRLVHWVESRSYKWAADQFSEPAKAGDKALPPPTVTVLRYTPEAFRNEFCGLVPVPRDPLAWAIEALASALKDAPPVHPVVGIDVDITEVPSWAWVATKHCGAGEPEPPSECSAFSGAQADATSAQATPMSRAIASLLKYADVVAITFDRCPAEAAPGPADAALPVSHPQSCSEAQQRDCSMAQLCKLNEDPERRRLSFATPDAYLDPAEPHYRFLAGLRPHGDEGRPAFFPSLGNLMALRASSAPAGVQDKAKWQKDRDSTLGFLCKPAPSAKRREELLGDVPYPGSGPGADYQWKYLDLLRGSVRVETRAISGRSDLIDAVRIESERWKGRTGVRPMLMLSLDDGRTDRYFTVMDMSDTTGGDYIHAVTALSLIEPLEEHRGSSLWIAALYDLLLGVVYLLAWEFVRPLGNWLRWRGDGWLASAFMVSGPLILGIMLGMAAVFFSAYELRKPVWNDPVLILIGLVLHTYLTMWESEESAEAGSGKAANELAGVRTLPTPRPWRPFDVGAALLFSALRLCVVVGVAVLVILMAMNVVPGFCS